MLKTCKLNNRLRKGFRRVAEKIKVGGECEPLARIYSADVFCIIENNFKSIPAAE